MKTALAWAFVLLAGPAAAQSSGWSFALTPYAWLPGMKTSTDTPFGSVDADTSGSDALSALDFAFMGALEARHGRWGLIGDLLYSDLSQDKDTPFGQLFSRARVETKVLAFTGYAAWRAYETDRVALDVLGGFRYYDMKVDLTLEPGTRQGRSFELHEKWTDPVIGGRARVDFTDTWFATGIVDYGGFDGSNDSTWQAIAVAGYQFNERWSLQGGWRYLDIEKEIGGRDVAVELSGPILGFTVRF
jgi:hypothetical protein